MRTYAELYRDIFRAINSAATAAPVDGVGFRTLICMLATIIPHWQKSGELLTYVSLDTLEARTMLSKSMVAKARRRLVAMGMIVRLTPPELRGCPVVYRVNVTPHVPLPFPAKMREVSRAKNRIEDLKRRQAQLSG
jgi:hypothetical protein